MTYYTIKSCLGNNLYLSIDAGRTNVSLKAGVSSANQQWRCSGLRHNVEIYSGSLVIYAINAKTNTWNCDVTTSNADTFVNFIPYGKYYKIQLASHTDRYLTAGGSSSGANVSWTTTSTGNSVYWDVQETELIVPPRSHIIQMPSGRDCNWNQFYKPIVDALNSEKGCTIVTALDLMNFYGPSSYTITDALPGWKPGIAWGTAWKGNFRAGTRYPVNDKTTLTQAEFFALIRSEVSQGRPVVVNVGTSNNDSHTVMCYGYKNGGTAYSDFSVMDPAGSGENNPNGVMRTLWEAMDKNNHTDGIWSMYFTYSNA